LILRTAPSHYDSAAIAQIYEEASVKASWGLIAALLAGVSGCASKSTVPDVTEDGLARVEIRGVYAAYRRPGADLHQYTKVLLDPVQVSFDPDWDPARTGSRLKLSAEDRERIRRELAELFMQVFAEELTKDGGPSLVTGAGPDVLRLSTGLADVYVNAPDTMEPGRSRTYVMSAGSATLVVEVRDSESGAILGRLFDRREAGTSGFMQWSDSVHNSAEARRTFTHWAQLLRQRFDAVRNAPAPPVKPG
jgi:hypothetical protein